MSPHTGLLATVSTARLHRYQDEADAQGVDVAAVYLWNLELSQALFQDLSIVEIGLRNAMSEQLKRKFGSKWFTSHDLFDDDTMKVISTAWTQGRLASLHAPDDVIHGKLVASFMLGFWVKLLGRGSHYGGRAPFKTRRIYDEILWKAALRDAFPNVGDTDRALVEKTASDVQAVRNRVAHHEAVIWGITRYGQQDASGATRRLSVTEAHDAIYRLAGYIDTSLEGWLRDNSQVPAVLKTCPVNDPSCFHL